MNRLKQSATGTGLSNLTLTTTPSGYKAFSTAYATNDRFYYCVEASNSDWEVGVGYLSSSTTLVREEILFSSEVDNSKVSFDSSTKSVFVTFVGSTLTLNNSPSTNTVTSNELELGTALQYVDSGVPEEVDTFSKGIGGDLSIVLPDTGTPEFTTSNNILTPNGRSVPINNGLIVIKDGSNYRILNKTTDVEISYSSGDLLVPSWQHFDVLWFRNGQDFTAGDYTVEYLGGAVNTTRGDLDAWTMGIEDQLYHQLIHDDGDSELILFFQAPQLTAQGAKDKLTTKTKTFTHTGGAIGINLFEDTDYTGLETLSDTILGDPPPTYIIYETP